MRETNFFSFFRGKKKFPLHGCLTLSSTQSMSQYIYPFPLLITYKFQHARLLGDSPSVMKVFKNSLEGTSSPGSFSLPRHFFSTLLNWPMGFVYLYAPSFPSVSWLISPINFELLLFELSFLFDDWELVWNFPVNIIISRCRQVCVKARSLPELGWWYWWRVLFVCVFA